MQILPQLVANFTTKDNFYLKKTKIPSFIRKNSSLKPQNISTNLSTVELCSSTSILLQEQDQLLRLAFSIASCAHLLRVRAFSRASAAHFMRVCAFSVASFAQRVCFISILSPYSCRAQLLINCYILYRASRMHVSIAKLSIKYIPYLWHFYFPLIFLNNSFLQCSHNLV